MANEERYVYIPQCYTDVKSALLQGHPHQDIVQSILDNKYPPELIFDYAVKIHDSSVAAFVCNNFDRAELYIRLYWTHNAEESLKTALEVFETCNVKRIREVCCNCIMTKTAIERFIRLLGMVSVEVVDIEFDRWRADITKDTIIRIGEAILHTSKGTIRHSSWRPSTSLVDTEVDMLCKIIEECSNLQDFFIYGTYEEAKHPLLDHHVVKLYDALVKSSCQFHMVNISSDGATIASMESLVNLVRCDKIQYLYTYSNSYTWTPELLDAIRSTHNLKNILISYGDPCDSDGSDFDEEKYPGYTLSRDALGIVKTVHDDDGEY